MTGVGMVMRKLGSTAKPVQDIKVENGKWTIITTTTFKTTNIEFRLGEEFEETTADGRKVMTKMTLEKNKLTQDQKGVNGGKDSVLVREVNGDTLTMTLTADNVVCKRTYKLVNLAAG
ncbi:unnamed protein product [Darwinula stevensoni]|uniref:Lipocalin/cytosolic fatty-acid binding domain-containing protein n=1 Tax=Darwinula stevensoni TaxID=69355 RepID=A0A7R8X578_9CRUS|nr:unnamed protein product [Darwinula stevensoni]CAG0884384.1 unnamed protein product [Darwinula stevensoni]